MANEINGNCRTNLDCATNPELISALCAAAIRELFVDWTTSNVTLDYAKYFKECSPTTCTFVYDEKPSSAALVTIVFGLIGGITAALDAVFAFIYKVCRRTIIGPPTGDLFPFSEGEADTHKKTSLASPSSGKTGEIGVVVQK